MNLLTIIREHKTSSASTALSLFMVAWLSMVVAPCAIATGFPSDHMVIDKSSHMPAMDDYAASDHMDVNSGSGYDCPRCPSQEDDLPCDVNDLNCMIIDNFGQLIPQSKIDDGLNNNSINDLELPPMVLSSVPTRALTPLIEFSPSINQQHKPLSGGTPLNVLYCVYLI